MFTIATTLSRIRSQRPSVRGIDTLRAGELLLQPHFVANRDAGETGDFLTGVNGDAAGHEIGEAIAAPLIEVECRKIVVGRRDHRAAQLEASGDELGFRDEMAADRSEEHTSE